MEKGPFIHKCLNLWGLRGRKGPTGAANPKYIDLLDEDKAVAGQKFACVSFISPENILKAKVLFYFEEFLKHWDFTKSMLKFTQFINFISYKYKINFDKLMADFKEFMDTEERAIWTKTTIDDDYKNFVDAKDDDLEKEFGERYSFQTNTRGLKIRGSYPSQVEAELRCKMLREIDPNHDVYVGPVGIWMPWNPIAYKTGRVEYLEEELNQLMHEKAKNEEQARHEFDKRVAESKRRAIEENKIKARATGNKLTQNIDAEGNLIGVTGLNTVQSRLDAMGSVSTADIRKELFEGADTRTRQTDKEAEADLAVSERTGLENIKLDPIKE